MSERITYVRKYIDIKLKKTPFLYCDRGLDSLIPCPKIMERLFMTFVELICDIVGNIYQD